MTQVNDEHHTALAIFAAERDLFETAFESQNQNGCVAINTKSVPGYVGVLDTDLGDDGPILAFPVHKWRIFAAALKKGQFDI